MIILLKDIATIQTGFFAKPAPRGQIVYLQARHFDENGVLSGELHPDLELNKTTEKHLLKPGDILFAAKGSKNFATVYEEHNAQAVASTTFFIIRLTQPSILPEYVAWLLNNPITQSFLKQSALGTAMVSISKAVLEDLEVSIPDMNNQVVILKIKELRYRELQLKQQIETLREKQILQRINYVINQ